MGGSPGLEPQVPGVQPHGADSGCAEKSSEENGGNSGGLVGGLPGGALLPQAVPDCEGTKAEAQADCGV